MRSNPIGAGAIIAAAIERHGWPKPGAAVFTVVSLKEIELRCTQARIASTIGRKSAKHRAEFLLGELERIQEVARAAINKAGGGEA